MSAVRRTAAVALIAACLVGGTGGPVLADAPSRTGWWNVVTVGGVALPQPTTGADDLHVSQGPSGPAAYAAVAYDLLGPDLTGATLQLAIVPSSAVGTVEVAACPTKTATWQAGGNQPFDAAPAYDCANGARGAASADGTSVIFLLEPAQLQPGGGFSLAIVPAEGAAPFSVDFAKPAATSLDVQLAAPADPAPPAAAPPAAPADSGAAPLALGVAPPAPPLQVAGPAPVTAPVAPSPQAAAAPVAPLNPVAARPTEPLSNRDRYAAGSLLALLAAGLVWAFQQPVAQPRLIGGMARKAAPVVLPVDARPRGIGRFATLRTAPARRLV